jgi:hypothetical protein
MRYAFALLTAASFSLAACGGEVVETLHTTVTGAGGAATLTSTSSSSTSSGPYCGGFGGIWCDDPNSFCRAPPDACGEDYGICTPYTTECPTECAEVCDCGETAWCNTCQAYSLGVSIVHDGPCAPTDPTYRAVRLDGGTRRFGMLVRWAARGLCFRTVAEASNESSLGIVTQGWAVQSIVATNDPKDCDVGPGAWPPPHGATAMPSHAKGVVGLNQGVGVCAPYLDAMVVFGDPPPPWLWSEESVYAPTVPIEGGCP